MSALLDSSVLVAALASDELKHAEVFLKDRKPSQSRSGQKPAANMESDTLRIERIMHGARDLPNRLLEDPVG